VAKTGNEPAITKGLQKIRLNEGIVFLDTPGILWPKIHNENSGYRLAASGAIKDTAMEVEDVALYLSDYLLGRYPELLMERYELSSLPATDIAFLELIGAKRGCLRSGGRVDMEKVSSILVNEFRGGILGCISLETPDMVAKEEVIIAQKRREKAEREALLTSKKQSSRDIPAKHH
jgi:ribosome biogenesis GTPase A